MSYSRAPGHCRQSCRFCEEFQGGENQRCIRADARMEQLISGWVAFQWSRLCILQPPLGRWHSCTRCLSHRASKDSRNAILVCSPYHHTCLFTVPARARGLQGFRPLWEGRRGDRDSNRGPRYTDDMARSKNAGRWLVIAPCVVSVFRKDDVFVGMHLCSSQKGSAADADERSSVWDYQDVLGRAHNRTSRGGVS
jgi:hypothetical protein